MKKIFTFVFMALLVMAANAKPMPGVVNCKQAKQSLDCVQKPQALMQEMHATCINPTVVAKASNIKDGFVVPPYWRRPAGVFPGIMIMENGVYDGSYYMPLYFAKPYVDYEFTAVADGVSNPTFQWNYQKYVRNINEEWEHPTLFYEGNPLVVNYFLGEENEVPELLCYDENNNLFTYQPGGYEMSGSSDYPVVGNFHVSYVEVTPTNYDFFKDEDVFLLQNSKTFCPGGRQGNLRYMMTYTNGCEPCPGNEEGWWFGKNAGRTNGIAQAFEKPTSPYLLRQVVLYTAQLEVIDNVEMTCHVYKLPNGIPAYDPENPVALDEEDFGEEIAFGRAELNPETNDATSGLVIFTLYNAEDGLEYEVMPTIDDAIIICIDGYNDEGMENLKNFTALISSDIKSDEGYGELAYIKYNLPDEDGNLSGEYAWTGLNNFFLSGQMMTGLTIFITADNPFLIYKYGEYEDCEFTFPPEGGFMEKPIHTQVYGDTVARGIDFLSYVPSVDEGWNVTLADGNDLPDWLSIELTDGEKDGEFDYTVNAEVFAEPLPDGINYREAVVRFAIPGSYLDFKFKQRRESLPPCLPPGEEPNISHVNHLIYLILENMYDDCYDINKDDELNIGDINALINIILKL